MAERPQASVLVAEDDRATRESVTLALQLEGYAVQAVGDGEAALSAIAAQHFDLAIFDVTMPYVDGLSACRRLRARGITLPILLLTARTEIADRVSGLDAGADDYLTKPFALDELLARIRALLRRNALGTTDGALHVGDLRIDEQARIAMRAGLPLDLTKTEFDLLALLAVHANQVLTPSVIYERIWGYDFGAESKNLAVYIGYLRRKLEFGGRERLIHTVRGVGYVLRTSATLP